MKTVNHHRVGIYTYFKLHWQRVLRWSIGYKCTCQAQKLPFIAILTWFLILGEIQDGSQDGYHCWWHHWPPAVPPPIKYTASCWQYKRLSTEGKIVSKCSIITKTLGRGSINPLPPPTLYHNGGMNLLVRLRANFVLTSTLNESKPGFTHLQCWQGRL